MFFNTFFNEKECYLVEFRKGDLGPNVMRTE